MIQFQNPQYLYLLILLLIPLSIHLLNVFTHRNALKKMGEAAMINALMPKRSVVRRHVKFGMLLTAAALLIVVVARPQYGMKQKVDTTKGIEAVVMIDVSNSMLANDVSPSRMDAAKLLVTGLVDRMKNDRIALGVFAGEAYPQLPITSDYSAAKTFIDAITPGMVTLQGTDIGTAITLASKSFSNKKEVGKAIILITDGEDHEGGADEAAAAAAKSGINIFVVGVGTSEGAQIPTGAGVLTDENGAPVHTALNEEMCRNVAKAGRGMYIHLDNAGSAQSQLQSGISQLKQSDSTITYTARDEQFQAVALFVLVLLILEVCVYETRSTFFSRFKLFKK